MKQHRIPDGVKILFAAVLAAVLVMIPGCRQARIVSYNVSKEADAFNVTRRITVINARTDTILLELTGTFALQNSEDGTELSVICEVGEGKYKKHFVRLNENTMYVVEDITGAEVSKYDYEVNILPMMGPLAVPTIDD